jgi:hypothetical protein
MRFWRKLFGDPSASSSRFSKAGILVCRGCGETYDLDRVVTISDDDMTNWARAGGSTLLGKFSGHPVLVDHSTRGPTSSHDQKTLQSLRRDPNGAWQCEKCHAKGTWRASYSQVKPGRTTLSDHIAIGLFFFNSDDKGISEDYDRHAKRAIRRGLRERVPRVLGSDYHVFSGDILGGDRAVSANIQNILSDSGCKCEALENGLRTSLQRGDYPGFVPYVLGTAGIPFPELKRVDRHLKHDKVAGYLGLTMFAVKDAHQAMEMGNGLALPFTELNPRL